MHFKFKINENNEIVNYQNRGMELEHELNETNSYYKDNKIALINKRPTPIKVVKCFNKKISEAYLKKLLLLITMVFIKENILILKQKKQPQKHLSL